MDAAKVLLKAVLVVVALEVCRQAHPACVSLLGFLASVLWLSSQGSDRPPPTRAPKTSQKKKDQGKEDSEASDKEEPGKTDDSSEVSSKKTKDKVGCEAFSKKTNDKVALTKICKCLRAHRENIKTGKNGTHEWISCDSCSVVHSFLRRE